MKLIDELILKAERFRSLALESQKKHGSQDLDMFHNLLTHIKNELHEGITSSLNYQLQKLPFKQAALVLFVLYMGGTKSLFDGFTKKDQSLFNILIKQLEEVDDFYKPIGGLYGYYQEVLLGIKKASLPSCLDGVEYLPPPKYDMQHHGSGYWKSLVQGIESLKDSAELYAVGGAGDRLNLKDEKSGRSLPAACLEFLGRNLLEGLIRDLEAKEYLCFKITGTLPTVPILLMTSSEKHNDEEILRILQDHKYFNRPEESFFRIIQPLAPMISEKGLFVVSGRCKLYYKPGGHGVVWKLADDSGAFSWLKSKGCSYLSIRQINNPLANLDCAPLVLLGIGSASKKAFGFAGCKRNPDLAEGLNVLEVTHKEPRECTITNYEYTKDALGNSVENGICECSANTNILFASISAIQEALEVDPFPGRMVNMKSHFVEENGEKIALVRLESTMQNIADAILDPYIPLSQDELQNRLRTYLAYFDRKKLFSVTKRLHGAFETPERALYDLLQYYRLALKLEPRNCIPQEQMFDDFVQNGPSLFIKLHPAFGSVEELIAKKLSVVELVHNTELELELAEVCFENVRLDGSLKVISSEPYSRGDPLKTPSCVMKNVSITNKGRLIGQKIENFWRSGVERNSCCEIYLQGNAAFFAEDVEIIGSIRFEVPEGHVLVASSNPEDMSVEWKLHPFEGSSAFSWKYRLLQEGGISLDPIFNFKLGTLE